MSEAMNPWVDGEQPELDGFGYYLATTKDYPLLTAEEEVGLAKQIEAGLYAKHKIEQAETAGESLPQVDDYGEIVEEGQKAFDRFIMSNQGLVISMAKTYQRRGHASEDLFDIIQNGQEGLIHAVKKFDYQKGFKFSTYATKWILQSFMRNGRDGLIRLPVGARDELSNIRRIRGVFFRQNGYFPDVEYVAQTIGCDPERVKKLLNARNPLYLNTPVGDDSTQELGDFLPDSRQNVEDEAINKWHENEVRRAIADHLGQLTIRQQTVIKLRYGIQNDEPMTLAEIGQEIGLTRERVRQIEKQALKLLRMNMIH